MIEQKLVNKPKLANKPLLSIPDTAWCLIAAAAFTVAQLLFMPMHMRLSFDEITGIAQVSVHASHVHISATHGRGVSLLAAPVSMLTTSVAVLRVYLCILSGFGLFLALLTWRRLRPGWVLALTGIVFGGLWTAQFGGSQVLPGVWIALTALATVGLFLRVLTHTMPSRRALPLLTAVVAFAVLVRPEDALFFTAPLIIAAAAVKSMRSWPLLAALTIGLAIGISEWVVEAYVWFGGPLARLHVSSREQPGGTRLRFSFWDQVQVMNGARFRLYPYVASWSYPWYSIWWLAFLALAVLGLYVARDMRVPYGSAALPAFCALSVLCQYVFFISLAKPFYLLPVYALLAILVADGLSWLFTRMKKKMRLVAVSAGVSFLLAGFVIQHLVLNTQIQPNESVAQNYVVAATDLHRLGIHPYCGIYGNAEIPIDYYTGCEYVTHITPNLLRTHAKEQLIVIVKPGQQPISYALHWRRYQLGGLPKRARLYAYIHSPSSRHLRPPISHG
jgi:hypothetical protein